MPCGVTIKGLNNWRCLCLLGWSCGEGRCCRGAVPLRRGWRGGKGRRKVRRGENGSMASEAAGTEADEGSWELLRAILCAGTKPHRPTPRAALLRSAEFKP